MNHQNKMFNASSRLLQVKILLTMVRRFAEIPWSRTNGHCEAVEIPNHNIQTPNNTKYPKPEIVKRRVSVCDFEIGICALFGICFLEFGASNAPQWLVICFPTGFDQLVRLGSTHCCAYT